MRGFSWLHVALCLMCGPRQLLSFQCGPETPQSWTPLEALCGQELYLCCEHHALSNQMIACGDG